MRKRLMLFVSILFLLQSCNKNKKSNVLFEFQSSKKTNINFTNKVENNKEFNIFSYRNFYNGGGVATGDINNDGLADVFFASNMGANKLYLNKGNFTFDDISAKAKIEEIGKWNTGVVMADVNADGWLDIYVCNAGFNKYKNKDYNKLFINNHDLTFTEKAIEYGLDDKGYTTHAAFFDYDKDGDLDCYILNNSFIPVNTLNYSNKRELRSEDWPVEDFAKGGGDKLMRNDNGHYVDVSKQANIYGSLIGFGLGVNISDVNKDNYPDIYVSNDFFERDYLYINQKNGTFKEELQEKINHTSLASMGADIADINNDDNPDIFTTDMLPNDEVRLKTTASFDNYEVYQYKRKQGFYEQIQQNALQVNNGNGKFWETANYSGVASSDWSWGALIFDADNDSKSDIYVCNGIYKDVIDQDFIDFFANNIIQKMALSGQKEDLQKVIDSMPSTPIVNKFFRNKGDLKFTDDGLNSGITQPSFSNGAAYADLDNDGDLDLIVNNVNMQSFVYKNTTTENLATNSISILLKDTGSNTFAVGSKIKIYSNNEIINREVFPARGFQSSIDYKNVIGLGKNKIDSIIIVWPNEMETKIDTAKLNQFIIIDYSKATKRNSSALLENDNYLFNQYTNSIFAKHNENEFVDFFQERNMPVMLSREGPKAAVADVNGDGLEDVFIGGAKGQTGQMYIQTNTGFVTQTQPFEMDKEAEDVAVLFFDADGDKDLDLFVGSGGNNLPPRNINLQHRIYINNGKGQFTKAKNTFDENSANISTAVALDFNNDGFNDLFVGGRNLSYNYGVVPNSALYQNDGKGNFTNVTTTIAPAIEKIGMVTSALFENVIGDSNKELIIVGEWMEPKIFALSNGKLQEQKTNLANMQGWWQTMQIADMDGDGKEDLILGNIGENFYLHPNAENPVKLWTSDFDKNGLPDKVFSKTANGKDVTVFLKKEFTEALPSFKKENLRYHSFANKTIQTLFTNEQLKNASIKMFNYSSSCIAYNKGDGNFEIEKLPTVCQLSSANAMVVNDINNDGKIDIVIGGNLPDCLPQFGRLDASFGAVLLNEGNRKMKTIKARKSGLTLNGVVRDLQSITIKNKKSFLVLRNNDTPIIYTIK